MVTRRCIGRLHGLVFWQLLTALFIISSAGSRRVRYWGRCYSCSTLLTLVSWQPVSACLLISTPTTRNSIRGATLHLMARSGAGWSWESSGSRSGCDLIDSVLILRRRSFFGARPADDVPIFTLRSSVSAALDSPSDCCK